MNGLGDETENVNRSALSPAHGTRVAFHGADMLRPQPVADMVAFRPSWFRTARHPRQKRGGSSTSRPSRSFDREVGRIIAINLSSAFHTIRAAVPGMKARRWGASSTSARRTRSGHREQERHVAANHGLAG